VCNDQTHKCEDPSAVCPNGTCEAGESYVSCPQDCPQTEDQLCSTLTCADGSVGYTICQPSCSAIGRYCWPDCGEHGIDSGGYCDTRQDCIDTGGFPDCGNGAGGEWQCGPNHQCYVDGCAAASPTARG
jgi:hypothetical protein